MSETSDLRVLMEHAAAGGYWEEAGVGARHPTYRMNQTSGEMEVLPGRGDATVGAAEWGPADGFPRAPWGLFPKPLLKPATFQECCLYVKKRANLSIQQEPRGASVVIMREGQPDTGVRYTEVSLDAYLDDEGKTDWVVRVNGCFVSPNGNGRK